MGCLEEYILATQAEGRQANKKRKGGRSCRAEREVKWGDFFGGGGQRTGERGRG